MKVVGGSFGADGKAEIGNSNIIANGHLIGRKSIKDITAGQQSQREFSPLALLMGLFLLTPLSGAITGFLLGVTAGTLATLAALIFTLFACYERKDHRLITITTSADKTVTIQCSKKEARRLMSFAPGWLTAPSFRSAPCSRHPVP